LTNSIIVKMYKVRLLVRFNKVLYVFDLVLLLEFRIPYGLLYTKGELYTANEIEVRYTCEGQQSKTEKIIKKARKYSRVKIIITIN
jgi:hypothetical protein